MSSYSAETCSPTDQDIRNAIDDTFGDLPTPTEPTPNPGTGGGNTGGGNTGGGNTGGGNTGGGFTPPVVTNPGTGSDTKPGYNNPFPRYTPIETVPSGNYDNSYGSITDGFQIKPPKKDYLRGIAKNPVINMNPDVITKKQMTEIFKDLIQHNIPIQVKSNSNEISGIKDQLSFIIQQNNMTHSQLSQLEERFNKIINKLPKKKSLAKNAKGKKRSLSSNSSPIPEKLKSDDPIIDDVLEVIDKKAYKKDKKRWIQVAAIPKGKSPKALVKNNYNRTVYWSSIDNKKGQIRVMEMESSRGKPNSLLVFAKSDRFKGGWQPYYFMYNKKRKKFLRYSNYSGTQIPNACVRCHGGSLKKLTPEVTLKNFQPHGWFFK